MIEQEWYKEHNCTYAYCPDGCLHPQPFIQGSDLFCGNCFVRWGVVNTMLPGRLVTNHEFN